MEIVVTRALLAQIEDERDRAFPEEACGLLLGPQNRIEHLVSTANVHPSPRTNFEIDPRALLDAHRAAREGGPPVLGYYHSHPSGPAAPSATDGAMAAGDGRVWAIAGADGVTFWRDDEDGFVALSSIVTDG